MFGDHSYLSGVTKTLRNHFYDVAVENVKQFFISDDDLVVDIGGNDGTQLQQYKKAGINNLLNVECAKRVSDVSRKNGIKTITEYFNRDCVEKYIGETCSFGFRQKDFSQDEVDERVLLTLLSAKQGESPSVRGTVWQSYFEGLRF